MDEQAFLNWLDEQDGYVSAEKVDEEWPEFWETYGANIHGVTVKIGDNGEKLYPTRDLRQAVMLGYMTD